MSRRVYVRYGDREYVVADRGLEELRQEIEAALGSGSPSWLSVHYGEGRPSQAQLLVAPGISIVLREEGAARGEEGATAGAEAAAPDGEAGTLGG
jgi:hypothetical protein